MGEEFFDWVIVGAGPAGSTLARLLRGAGRILLLDRRPLDREFTPDMPGKCCGGLLSEAAQHEFARQRLALPQEVLGGPQLFGVRALDLETGDGGLYAKYYWNCDREKFDRWLLSLALGDEVICRCGAEFLAFENGVVIYRREGRNRSVRCRFLVAADGAASAVRHRCQAPGDRKMPAADRYVAIQEHYRYEGGEPWFGAYFDRRLTDFYGWTIPKKNTLLLGGIFARNADAPARFAALKRQLEERGKRFGSLVRREGAIVLRPRSAAAVWAGEGKIFAVGEAGGWISPSSAEGFSHALKSARLLARLFREEPEPDAALFRRELAAMDFARRLKNLKNPPMYWPWLRRLIFKTGAGTLLRNAALNEEKRQI